MSDDVASRSGFLCTYMSNHPDTLVAYVRHFGNVTVPVASASMISIDSQGMTLSYVLKGNDTKKQINVLFQPPLSGYSEVKPRLLGMKLDAEEALGMTRRPQITTFELPRDAYITTAMIAVLVYVTFSVPKPYSSVQNIGPWIRSIVGAATLRYIWIGAAAIHAAETLYVLLLCKRHSTGLIIGAQWVTCTFVFGFPVWGRLRQLIQTARIDSITKIH